jgi:hypothetical protein
MKCGCALRFGGLPSASIRKQSLVILVHGSPRLTLDSSCSMAQGRPPAALETDCDVELLPLAAPCDASTSKIFSDTYTWRVRLAKIENRLSRLLVSPQSTTARIKGIEQLDSALLQWRNGLSAHLRPEEDFLVDRDTYQFVAVVHLEYFNLLRATHWASINCVRTLHQAGESLGTRVRSSEALCLAAARSFVRTLNEYAAHISRHSNLLTQL